MKKVHSSSSKLTFERPFVTVDVVIFAIQDEQLKVLLTRRPAVGTDPFPGLWALPGGFVDVLQDHTLLDCAVRKLKDKTGVETPYLEQLGSWGGDKRDPRGWSVTQAYFALISVKQEIDQKQVGGSTETAWFAVDDALRKRLAFDHAQILSAAIDRVRSKVEYTSLPAFLMDEAFTLPQLQRVYEFVLGRPMDKSAFRKRMLDADFLEEVGMIDGLLGRTAMGYRIRNRDTAVTFPRMFRASE